jgi:hypothetical protein
MKVRNLLISLILAAMVLCAGVSSSAGSGINEAKASATPGCPTLPVKLYYTDATMTVQCGEYSFCYDSQIGCVTPYVTSVRRPCCQQ